MKTKKISAQNHSIETLERKKEIKEVKKIAGEHLCKVRIDALKLSQETMAEMLGVADARTICRYETGELAIPPYALVHLHKLGVDLNWLVANDCSSASAVVSALTEVNLSVSAMIDRYADPEKPL